MKIKNRYHMVPAEWLEKLRIDADTENERQYSQMLLIEHIQQQFPAIEEPSDEEINKQFPTAVTLDDFDKNAFNSFKIEGVKWLRDKIFKR